MIVKYWQAVNRALRDALHDDDSVIFFGEDVADAGGSFGASRGLLEEFGPDRVRDTPISEASLVGMAVGASMTGCRPVVEIMFMDFMTLTMDQVVNQAAKIAYMSGGAFHSPLVIRTVCGAGRGTGPQHGQSFDGWLANVPGIKVLWPASPGDAYGLLRAAIEDDGPVIVIESLRLWNEREDLVELRRQPIGIAKVARIGDDVTAVAWGGTVSRVLAAATMCASVGIEVEVLDLRTLNPMDEQAILNSISKTGKLVIVEDGPGHVSVGAQIAAIAAGPGFGSLTVAAKRIHSPFAPVPFSPKLEHAYFPSTERIAESLIEITKEK